jgi:hypothetical protein
MVLSLMVLAACDSNSEITAPKADALSFSNIYQVNAADNGSDVKGISYPLTSERDLDIGHIFVSNDEMNIYVSYYMHDSWLLRSSYLHIGRQASDVPMDSNGNPDPKAFPYISESNRGITEYRHKVPMSDIGVNPGDRILIASLVDVIKLGGNGKVADSEVIWSDNEPAPSNQWWSFFGFVLRDELNNPGNGSESALWEEAGFSKLK